MMDSQLPPLFDGHKWKCARCNATLAKVVEAERFTLPTMQKRIVTALELPPGFIKTSGNVWLRPKNYLPSGRGSQNQKQRIQRNRFTERQLEVAQEKSDYASISEAQRKIARTKTLATQGSSGDVKVAPMRLHAEELPIRVKCAKPGCETVSQVPSIRTV
jgi:hypothetical protein